jgi:hypothetical protein
MEKVDRAIGVAGMITPWLVLAQVPAWIIVSLVLR